MTVATPRKSPLACQHRRSSSIGNLAPLAACVVLALAPAGTTAAQGRDALPEPFRSWEFPAGLVLVENCNDSGPGSLREALASAPDQMGIGVVPEGCSTITLTTGELAVHANDLIVFGSGRSSLIVSGDHRSRVFAHDGGGGLNLFTMTVRDGTASSDAGADARGGCLYSAGSVYLHDVAMAGCRATADGGGAALGGGLYARTRVRAIYSVLSDNLAQAASAPAYGGAIHSAGTVKLDYTSLLRNAVVSGNAAAGEGGGLWSSGDADVFTSTFQGNSADAGGAIGAGAGLHLENSTVHGNSARAAGGGLAVHGSTQVASSTITGNIEASPDAIAHGAGISLADGSTLELQGSIVAENLLVDSSGDIGPASDIGSFAAPGAVVTGADNLVGHSTVALPPDTLVTDDPQLRPLQGNGGLTLTRMPLSTSPVVNAGAPDATSRYDQRGPGYPRLVAGVQDIGAVESPYREADRVFVDGFD